MASLQQLLNRVDGERVTQLLHQAVNQYSPSYAEEPVVRVFVDALERAGVPYTRQPVSSHPDAPSRANLIVELGPRPPELMWVGHVDTIPYIDEEEQIPRHQGDVLYGLGAADMKSGCAAAIEAVTAIIEADLELKRGLCVALVVGEEEYGDGSEVLLEHIHAPLTIIGEPTGLAPCVNHYGYYECRLFGRGAQAHAALPEVGANAIHAMLSWMTQILEEGHQLPFAERMAMNPREIRGGADLFVVAESCEAQLDVHVPPGIGPEPVKELIERARERVLESHPRCELDYEEIFWAPGFANDLESKRVVCVREAFESVGLEWEPTAFRSHSDGALFHQDGSVPVVCGPGRLEVAHTRNEHVSLKEVEQAARLYAALIHTCCIRS